MSDIIELNSIQQIHNALGLPSPEHPLISIIQMNKINYNGGLHDVKIVVNLFHVAFKKGCDGELTYGRNSYDFEDGTLVFTAPGQVLSYDSSEGDSGNPGEGWSLVFHPDLLLRSDLSNRMESYSFFDYDVSEALHISEKELKTLNELLEKIKTEYSQNLDQHSQHLIVANVGLLLDYCLRFYDRQFLTRTNLNADIISKFERLLREYYRTDKVIDLGIPNVHYCSEQLNYSANYLSDLLKKETGKTAKEHIHLYIIEQAKNRLLNSSDSISEIGFSLGFEHAPHFSSLFKAKTGMTPKKFRNLS